MSKSRSSDSECDDIIISIPENTLSLNELCRVIPRDVILIVLNLLHSKDLYKISFINPTMRKLCAEVYSQRPEAPLMRMGLFKDQILHINRNINNEITRQSDYERFPVLLASGGIGTFVSVMALLNTSGINHSIVAVILTVSLLLLSRGIMMAGQKLNSNFAINDMHDDIKNLNNKITEHKLISYESNLKYI